MLILFAAILPTAALTPSGPTSTAPASVQQPRNTAQPQHLTPPFLPHAEDITPTGISGFTTYLPEGPQISITFWKGMGFNTSFTNVQAQFSRDGHPVITVYNSDTPQVTDIQHGSGTSVVIGSKASAQVPFLTGTSKYGPFVVTFLLTDNGKWLEPRFTLQNQAGCTNGIKIAPTNGTVIYGDKYPDLANFGPFGPQVYLGSRGDVVTSLGFLTNAPYSPYGDVQKVGRDYTTSLGSAHLGFAWHHGVGNPTGVSCGA